MSHLKVLHTAYSYSYSNWSGHKSFTHTAHTELQLLSCRRRSCGLHVRFMYTAACSHATQPCSPCAWPTHVSGVMLPCVLHGAWGVSRMNLDVGPSSVLSSMWSSGLQGFHQLLPPAPTRSCASAAAALCLSPCPRVALYLQSLAAQLRSRELSLSDAESQLAAKDEALAAAGQETANMHKVRVQSLGVGRVLLDALSLPFLCQHHGCATYTPAVWT